jgi:hypothetical protein
MPFPTSRPGDPSRRKIHERDLHKVIADYISDEHAKNKLPTTLHVTGRDFSDLRAPGSDPIRIATHRGPLSSFRGLKRLANVVAIDLSYCASLESIDDVRGREDLRSLRLIHCPLLRHIDALATVPNLEELSLMDSTSIRDLRPIAKLAKLRELMVWGNAKVPKELWKFYKSRQEIEVLQAKLKA